MDDKKIIKLNLEQKKSEEEVNSKKESFKIFQTNPVIKKLFFINIQNKKGKFKLKDLFNL